MSEAGKAPTDPYIGQVIQGRYAVRKVLGTGGMGAVYLAEQTSIGRQVALKVLRRDATQDNAFVRRFQHEARLAGAINHPLVVTIYDFGEIGDGNLFLAMEYVPGDTLRTLMQEQQPLSVQRAVAISLQIAEALQAVHRAGVLHRDIKPENVVVHEGDEIKLMDFGIARQLDAQAQDELTHLTQTGMLVGSPRYMAPEQIDGRTEVSERTDIYAWGVVLYELLTGQTPFVAPTPQAVLIKHLQERPQLVRQQRSEVPVEVEQVVMRALEKEAQYRQQNMGEVISALRKIQWEEIATELQQNDGQQEAPTLILEPSRRLSILKVLSGVLGGLLVVWGVVTSSRVVLTSPSLSSLGNEKITPPFLSSELPPSAEKQVARGDQTIDTIEKSPLSIDTLVTLLQQETVDRLMEEVSKRGVNFDMNSSIRKRLREAGANNALLMAVEQASFTYTGEKFRREQEKMKAQSNQIEGTANR